MTQEDEKPLDQSSGGAAFFCERGHYSQMVTRSRALRAGQDVKTQRRPHAGPGAAEVGGGSAQAPDLRTWHILGSSESLFENLS